MPAEDKKSRLRSFLLDTRGKIWFFINMFFTTVYLIWRIFFTIPFDFGLVSVIASSSLFIVEVLGMVEAFVHYLNMFNVHDYPRPEVPLELFPDIDVFVPTYNEGVEIIDKTLNACKHLKYPDKSKVHIYLCDDGNRDEMEKLVAKRQVTYLTREKHEHAKAGNLNNALDHSSSPYIVTIDADMILKSDFLMKTVPYFVDAELRNEGREKEDRIELGFIQTPQSFYNPDMFQFNLFSENRIPDEQDYFYKDIQVARTRTNSVIYGGSNTLISRKALMDAGKFYTNAITEDFATGILIEEKQYVSLGLGETLASGLAADSLHDLIQQRVRWARGVIATGRKLHIYTSQNLSFAQKMNYWASVWYWYAPLKRFVYIMSPIIYATFGYMVFKCTLPQILLFWLPMYVSSNISLKMLSHNVRTTKWTSIYETALFPFLLLPVIMETFGISLRVFKVTNKSKKKTADKGGNILHMVPFLFLIVLSVFGIINCIVSMFNSSSLTPVVVLFWLVYNLFLLVMSLFFVNGRVQHRSEERANVKEPAVVSLDNGEIKCTTSDISESGLSVKMDKPYYMKEDEPISVTVSFQDYTVTLSAIVVYVKQNVEGDWLYSMKIKDFHGMKDDWLMIIYDRIPTLPVIIRNDAGSFDDLRLNMKKRVTAPFYQKRCYPRVLLDMEIPCKEIKEGKIKVHDFNYAYFTLSEEAPELTDMHVAFSRNAVFELEFDRVLRNGKKLYSVKNLEEVMDDREAADEVLEFLVEHEKNAEVEKKRAQRKKSKKAEQLFNDMSFWDEDGKGA
ncbi:MAG: glycosyltransferase [Lachnospiraceae bacterium]|nr:glycosyltransferase [Lachnospiraceae bacterium]